MPTFTYRCAVGHDTDRAFTSFRLRTRTTCCGACPRRARFSMEATYKGIQVIRDVPEHMNMSLGQVVRSRKHLKQLQKKYNCSDWQPTNNSPGSQISKDILRKQGLA